jgi:hypothetical protein
LTAESKGTVEALFGWMTQRFERRLPNTSYGVHDAETAAQAGGMTLEELERCFYQAVVDDYQQDWDDLRRQRRCVLWEQAVAQSGVPQYLGSPDDLKLLLMKAVNRKTPGMAIACKTAVGFHFRDDGMSAPACSRDWQAESLTCITTAVM